MTRTELPAQAANVQRAAGSATTCTSATVDSLRLLLPSSPPAKSLEHKPSAPPRRIKSRSTTSGPVKGKNRAKQTTDIVLEISQENNNILSLEEKLALATGVVNASLKALTEAVKNPLAPEKFRPKKAPLPRSSSASSFSNSADSRSPTPLQPICANRVSTPVREGELKRRSSSNITTHALPGLRSQAECARIGFATLRSLQTRGDIQRDLPHLQLETGMSSLIGKLLALSFDDLALKELRVLKRRLEGSNHITAKKVPSDAEDVKPMSEECSTDLRKETVAALLKFHDNNARGPLLALIVTSQLQTLRILAIQVDRNSIESALPHLQKDVPTSPFNMIKRQIDPREPESKEKAARQLDVLARSLLNLCPNTSSAIDESIKSNSSLPPESAFRLQLLAFETRATWWKLLGHQIDVSRDLIGPFSRSLGAFQRRCRLEKRLKYDTAKHAFRTVSVFFPGNTESKEPLFLDVYQSLADLAQETMDYGDAFRWLENALKTSVNCGASQVQSCSLKCRVASVRLRGFGPDSDNTNLVEYMRDAIDSLQGDLHGESAELDDLLIAIASLRRSAFGVYQESYKSTLNGQVLIGPVLADHCLSVILLCLRYLIRYLGKRPGSNDNEKATMRFQQRRKLARQVTRPVIDSIVCISKLSAQGDSDLWERLDVGLLDCAGLASDLEQSAPEVAKRADTTNESVSLFVTISSAHWCRYLHLKRDSQNVKTLRKRLRLAIELIRNRPCREKMTASFTLKLEKYGLICESLKDYYGAAEAYEEAIRVHIENGDLHRVASSASIRSLPEVLDSNGEFGLLARLVLAYPRAALHLMHSKTESRPFLVFEWLSIPEMGVLLEQQLNSMISILHSQGPSTAIYDALFTLLPSLLALYTNVGFPLRRLHIIVQLLQINTNHPAAVDREFLDNVLRDHPRWPLENPSDPDDGLRQYASHLIASRTILVALRQNTPDLNIIETTLAEWSSLLQNYPDWCSLQTQVYDIENWLAQLEFIADYLAMQGLDLLRISALNLLVTVQEAKVSTHCDSLVSKLSALGLQYVRAGYTDAGRVVLHKARKYTEVSSVPWQVIVRWHLSYAEYVLVNGNLESCKDNIDKAIKLLKDHVDSMTSERATTDERWSHSQIRADANHLQSELAIAEGRSGEALFLARLCVRKYTRSWAFMEHRQRNLAPGFAKNNMENAEDALANSMADLSIPGYQATKTTSEDVLFNPTSRKGVAYWNLVPRLFRSLRHLSCLYAHQGLVMEARYYSEQSRKIANAVHALAFVSQSLTQQGQYSIRSREMDQGIAQLQQAESLVLSGPRDREFASLQICLATCYIVLEQHEPRKSSLVLAEKTLQKLRARSFLNGLVHKPPGVESTILGVEAKMSGLTLQEPKPGSQRWLKNRPIVQKSAQKFTYQASKASLVPTEDLPSTETAPLSRLRWTLLVEQVRAKMSEGNLELAASLLDQAIALPHSQSEVVLQALLTTNLQLRRSLQELAEDPVFSVVPESTISCPSVSSRHEREFIKDVSYSPQKRKKGRSEKSPSKNTVARKPRQGVLAQNKDHTHFLSLAQSSLSSVYKLARTVSSTTTFYEITDVLGRVLMLLSAISSDTKTSVSAPFIVHITEAARMSSMMRSSLAVEVERKLSSESEIHDWRSENVSSNGSGMDENIDLASFQAQYIDIIPTSWTALSITLTESNEEILISRIRAGQNPFILRLPLSRQNGLDCDEETFSFQEGRAELQDIVDKSNFSSQDARDLSQRGAKTEWWETRNALDARLKDLLNNVERLWLGGFRGILSPASQNTDLLSRFQQSLHNILDKHLPSRQKSGKAHESTRITLDPRVLELFIGLGDPNKAEDVEEPLMDLLYFVVDILQFNGERNAYDEIDFDAAVIDTLDALRYYHQAAAEDDSIDANRHTILILDRNLHCFPWESLPCMKGQSVSRLPSLACLRRRILQQRRQQIGKESTTPAKDGFCVDQHSGAFILNPGGDLINTQAKFEEPLQGMSNWNSIVQRAPEEAEMKDCLENRQIFLYFGHGSGGQYIRPRVIKKLERCAVALLMGCSSGALTEAGNFEPYGTPIDYLLAGCPALLATLWDVTDKDIDRFSYTVLEKWGLFGRQPAVTSSPVKKSAKQKGKSKGKETNKNKDLQQHPMSLDEAVAQGRDSCILRYLNGAAPVVYGIPVFLS